MVQGIRLVNFANHKNTRLTFGRLTALVGQNSAGKTNAMRAIQSLSQSVQERQPDQLFDLVGTTEWGRIRFGSQTMAVMASGEGMRHSVRGAWGLHCSVMCPHPTTAVLQWDKTWLWHRERKGQSNVVWIPGEDSKELPMAGKVEHRDLSKMMRDAIGDDEKHDGSDNDESGSLPQTYRLSEPSSDAISALRNVQYFKASAEALSKPSYPLELPPRLTAIGENLASALATMMTKRPNQFRLVVEALKSVVPIVRGIRADRAPVVRSERRTISVNKKDVTYDEEQIVHGDQLIFDMASGEGISAQDVSEGTLLTLSLLTLLHGEPAPRVLLLDDVERGLHPRAQRDLIEQLRKVLELRPELQIILSSHSPYVIDQLKPEEVWLLAPDKEGCAVSRRLADHPNAVRALEVLTTGEFWSAEGEEWVLNEAAK